MIEDTELLRRYAEMGSESAFAELVQRRIGLVYAVALRQTQGDVHRAEEVTQRVFTDLARKARMLTARPVLAGWLCRSAHFAASDLRRADRRRATREQEAQTMQELSHPETGDGTWKEVRPLLDQALSEMDERDRDAIVLRFFDGRPFGDVGERLRLTENAARMRVERALEKLRLALARRGVKSTSAALSVALANQVAVAVPAGLTASVTSGALTSGALTGGIVGGLMAFMGANQLPLGVAALVGAAALVVVTRQAQASARLQDEASAAHAMADDLTKLRAENLRLARAATELAQLREEAGELPRLRVEVAVLRQRAAWLNSAPVPTPPPAGRAVSAGDSVTMHLPDADLDTVLSAYRIYSGKRVARDSSLIRSRPIFNLIIEKPVPKEEALAALHALLQANGVDVLPTADGGLVAIRRNTP